MWFSSRSCGVLVLGVTIYHIAFLNGGAQWYRKCSMGRWQLVSGRLSDVHGLARHDKAREGPRVCVFRTQQQLGAPTFASASTPKIWECVRKGVGNLARRRTILGWVYFCLFWNKFKGCFAAPFSLTCKLVYLLPVLISALSICCMLSAFNSRYILILPVVLSEASAVVHSIVEQRNFPGVVSNDVIFWCVRVSDIIPYGYSIIHGPGLYFCASKMCDTHSSEYAYHVEVLCASLK